MTLLAALKLPINVAWDEYAFSAARNAMTSIVPVVASSGISTTTAQLSRHGNMLL